MVICSISYTQSIILCHLISYHTPPNTDRFTLSLHDALPICTLVHAPAPRAPVHQLWADVDGHVRASVRPRPDRRSEEHTSELQSRFDLVCRLLLEKKKISVYSIMASTNS